MGVSASTGSQILQVTTIVGPQNFSVSFSTDSNPNCGNWLFVSAASSNTTGTVTGVPVMVAYTVNGLPPYSSATCNGSVAVTTTGLHGATVTVPVTLAISPQPGYCVPTLTPRSALFLAGGGTGSASLSLPAGCSWRAYGNPSWLSITSNDSGTGNGTVDYSVAPNTGPLRNATLMIGGARFMVTQMTGPAYLVSTIAGGALPATAAPATSVAIPMPWGVAVDSAGNVFFDGAVVPAAFKVDSGGMLTRVAGTVSPGFSGDGGPGISAQLGAFPQGLAADGAGNLYITDISNSRIRKVAPDGTVTTVAGNGNPGYAGDGGPATSASLLYPHGVKADGAGNLFIADCNNQRVRRVSVDGTITTVAGNGTSGFSGDGGPATSAQLACPYDVAVDTAGNLFIADNWNNRVRKVDTKGVITTFAGNGSCCYSGDNGLAILAQIGAVSVAVDALENVYIAGGGPFVRKVSKYGVITTAAGGGSSQDDGVPAANAQLIWATGVAVDASGNLYIADGGTCKVRKISTSNIITTIAGSGGAGDGSPAAFAEFSQPGGIARDKTGILYVTDMAHHRVQKITPTGMISTVAGTGAPGYQGDGGPASAAQLGYPRGVTLDAQGNLLIADSWNNRIRKVASDGTISTVAGGGCCSLGDGGQATNAQLSNPSGVALDAHGNLYIADANNERIRVVSPAGIITTLAGNGTTGYSGDGGQAVEAQLNNPHSIAPDANGNLFIVDTNNHSIRKVSSDGTITTEAGNGQCGYSGDGGQASSAQLCNPFGAAVDASGDLYIMDSTNNRVRVVSPSGVITTLAGNGNLGYSGDGGPAVTAQLNIAYSVFATDSGTLYIADTNNNAIRLLAPAGTQPVLSIGIAQNGSFARGQSGAYTLTVANAASSSPTSGVITVTEMLPAGLTLVSMGGSGWNCNGNTCTRSDALLGGSFPPITVTMNVSATAPLQVTNQVTVSGGGAAPAGAQNLTVVSARQAAITAVTNNASGQPVIESGSWVSIYGTDLSATTRPWQLSDFSGNSLPTIIDGVRVTINEKPAAIAYVSPGMLNVLAPSDTTTGQVPVQVQSPYGTATGAANLQTYSPAFFAAGKYVAAVHLDGTYVAPVGFYGTAVASRPAKPGETILLFGTGFGPTSPTVPADQIFSGAAPLTDPSQLQISIGSNPATVQFAGLVANGEYQFNVVVPALSDGDQGVIGTIGGLSTQPGLLIAVKN